MAADATPAPSSISGKGIAEYASAIAAIIIVVFAALLTPGFRPFGTDYPLYVLIGAALLMTFAFGRGFEWASGVRARRQLATLIRKYQGMVSQLAFLVTEVYEASSSTQARINEFGYVAQSVQQAMAGDVAGSNSQKVSEKAWEILSAWTAGHALRTATHNTVKERCRSDAARWTSAFCQALEETQGLAVAAMSTISSFLSCIRRGFPCDRVDGTKFDEWATVAGRVNQYQTQLGYLIRDANTLFGTDLNAYFRPVPPWLWLPVGPGVPPAPAAPTTPAKPPSPPPNPATG